MKTPVIKPEEKLEEGTFTIDASKLIQFAEKAKQNNLSLQILGKSESGKVNNSTIIHLIKTDKIDGTFNQDRYLNNLQGTLTEAVLAVVDRRS